MRSIWKDNEMFNFCMNMATVLESGLSIEEGLDVVKSSIDVQLQDDINTIQEQIQDNGSLSASIQNQPFIDDYAKKMIEIGEMSGTLDNVMKELALYYERNYDLKQNLKEALIYPFLLILMMWVIVLLIIWKVLPIFASVLYRMGTILPDSTSQMMQFGRLFGGVSFILLSVLIVACVLVYLINRRAKGSVLAHVPFTKRLFYNLTMAKMTYAFSLFISSGYDVEEALSYLPDVIDHPKTKERLQRCLAGMKQGANFVDTMMKEKLYSGLYANMIYTGFRTGKGEDVLKKASSLYEKDVDNSISSFLNIIEPIVVIALSVIVGVILLSVMLPLMSIMTSI